MIGRFEFKLLGEIIVCESHVMTVVGGCGFGNLFMSKMLYSALEIM